MITRLTPKPKANPNTGLSLKGRALAYLARREHTLQELRQKLIPYCTSAIGADLDDTDSLTPLATLETLLAELQAQGWLSDARYAESRVRTRASRYGNARLKQELRQQGVDDATIATTLAPWMASELSRAQAVWSRKFKQLPDSLAERGRQTRYLLVRGFSHTVIAQVLRGGVTDFADDTN
jgi:regulatory protein